MVGERNIVWEYYELAIVRFGVTVVRAITSSMIQGFGMWASLSTSHPTTALTSVGSIPLLQTQSDLFWELTTASANKTCKNTWMNIPTDLIAASSAPRYSPEPYLMP